MLQTHSPSARAARQTGHAALLLLPAKSPASTSSPDPLEPWDVARSRAIAASAAALDIPGDRLDSPTNDPAARASPCPIRLHPDKARTAASPRGTAVPIFFLCPSFLRQSCPCQSWHHLD